MILQTGQHRGAELAVWCCKQDNTAALG